MTWQSLDIASVVSVMESGSRPKGGATVESGDIPSLGGENILRYGGVNLEEVKRVPRKFFERMTKGQLKNGDVLINKDGAQTGKVGLYKNNNDAVACINEHLFLIRGDANKIIQPYLYYSLLSPTCQNQIDAQISGSAQPGLKSDFLKGVFASIPKALQEQSKITEVLSKVDQGIDQTEALIAKQQRIKTSLMQGLLTKGIDKQGNLRTEESHEFKDSPMGMIPAEWEIKRLEEMTVKIVDGVHHTPSYVDYGMPFLVITDLTAGPGIRFDNTRFITVADHRAFRARANPIAGDVLVTKDGTLGVARIVKSEYPEFSIFVSLAMIRPRRDYCLPELIYYFFDSGEFLIQLGALSAGTGLSHIHLEHFRKFQLRCPPLEEQKIIIDIIKQQEIRLTNCHNDLNKLKRLKNALMQDLLTGMVRVTPLMENMAVSS
jgi:type I restriction enzyme S subunit